METIADRYQITRELGRGGHAVVYEARDRHLDRMVALKLLHRIDGDTAAIERFHRELRVQARLHHPNLCNVTDSGFLRTGARGS